jgi:hypothetical protein
MRAAFADLSGRQFILGCLSPLTQGLLHFNIYCDGTLASYADQRNLHPPGLCMFAYVRL